MAAQAVPCWQGARAFWGRDGGLSLASSHGVYSRHHRAKATAGTCWDGSLDLDFRGLGRGDKSVLMVLQVCDCGWMGICVWHSIPLLTGVQTCFFLFCFVFFITQSDSSTDGNRTSTLKQHIWIWWWGVTKATSLCAFRPFLVYAVSIMRKKKHLYSWYIQKKLFRLINSTYR